MHPTPTIEAPRPQAAAAHRLRWSAASWIVLLIVWLACAAYMGAYLKRGWIPHDEGSFGLSAERVLHGDLPHRDFDELYTGGLTYLNALSFRVWGTNLASMRYMLLAFALAWIPALFACARRFTSPLGAGLLTLLAAAWSIPNYSSPVPSWYNLFFATFGTLAALRYIEDGRARWLLVAGLCGGLSALAKISGLYFIAAVLLFLVFREQDRDRAERPNSRAFSVVIIGGLLIFSALVFKVFSMHANPRYMMYFVLPPFMVVALLMWREAKGTFADFATRARSLFLPAFVLLAGFLIPVLIFLVPYARGHGLRSLVYGTLILPAKRFVFSSNPPGSFKFGTILSALVLLALLIWTAGKRSRPIWILFAIPLALAFALWETGYHDSIYRAIFYSVVPLIPFTAVYAFMKLRTSGDAEPTRREQLVLLLAVVIMVGMVQYPFAAPIYFCYVAPLIPLLWLALFASQQGYSRAVAVSLAVFYLAFAVWRNVPTFIEDMGMNAHHNEQKYSLDLPRAGGIRVEEQQAIDYKQLVQFIGEHARGEYIYAAPDCPEVYFLSGYRNPTRTLFDFFDDPNGRTSRILKQLEEHHVNAIVVYDEPAFSNALSPDLETALDARYPNSRNIGSFEVRWR